MDFFFQANQVENFLKRFCHPFENLESRIWHSMIYAYSVFKTDVIDEAAIARGFVVYVDHQHTRKGELCDVGCEVRRKFIHAMRWILLCGMRKRHREVSIYSIYLHDECG